MRYLYVIEQIYFLLIFQLGHIEENRPRFLHKDMNSLLEQIFEQYILAKQ